MRRIIAIAQTTYREAVRSKVMYSLLFFCAFVIAVAALFGTVTIGDQIRVIKDFGLASISLFSVGYAVIVGASLLHKELTRKTVYNILAKPVRRSEFLLGKYFGMLAISSVMVLLMGAGLSLFSFLFSGEYSPELWQGYLFMIFELAIVCAFSIFFSSIVVTPLLAGLFTFGVFLAGRSADYINILIERTQMTGLPAQLLELLYYTLPHLHQLSIANQVVYGKNLALNEVGWFALYVAAYSGVLLSLSTIFFRRREFN